MQLTTPEYLLLNFIPVLLFFLYRFTRKTPSPSLYWLGYPLPPQVKANGLPFKFLFFLGTLSFFLFTVALAGPFLLKVQSQSKSEGIDLILLLDVSESMEADDFAPRRIDVAKKVIRSFIQRRKSDRIGLIIFSGDTLVKTPLSLDYEFLIQQLESVETGHMKQGTAIGMGLLSAVNRLKKTTRKNKVIVLLTDGDSNVGAVNPITASLMAAQEKIKIYPIGIGQKDRVIVPIYAKDFSGRKQIKLGEVPSYLNPQLLKNIALITGGKAYMARDPNSLNQMLIEIDALEKSKALTLRFFKKQEVFWIPLSLGLLLFIFLYVLLETRYRRVLP